MNLIMLSDSRVPSVWVPFLRFKWRLKKKKKKTMMFLMEWRELFKGLKGAFPGISNVLCLYLVADYMAVFFLWRLTSLQTNDISTLGVILQYNIFYKFLNKFISYLDAPKIAPSTPCVLTTWSSSMASPFFHHVFPPALNSSNILPGIIIDL